MPFFQGKMPEYMGNKMGSFGSMKAASGTVSKAPKGRGRKTVGSGMNNKAKAPMGRSNMKMKKTP